MREQAIEIAQAANERFDCAMALHKMVTIIEGQDLGAKLPDWGAIAIQEVIDKQKRAVLSHCNMFRYYCDQAEYYADKTADDEKLPIFDPAFSKWMNDSQAAAISGARGYGSATIEAIAAAQQPTDSAIIL